MFTSNKLRKLSAPAGTPCGEHESDKAEYGGESGGFGNSCQIIAVHAVILFPLYGSLALHSVIVQKYYAVLDFLIEQIPKEEKVGTVLEILYVYFRIGPVHLSIVILAYIPGDC